MLKIKLEIADSPSTWSKGLMYRSFLEKNSGMFFDFKKEGVLDFWGLNTYIPLDIAFIDKNNKIIKIDMIKPLSLSKVSSIDKCDRAIEVNYGFFRENNINVGDNIKTEMVLEASNNKKINVSFIKNENNKHKK